MLAGILLPFLATVAGKVIGDAIWPASQSRRPSGSDGRPTDEAAATSRPSFAQTLAGQTAAVAKGQPVAAPVPGPAAPGMPAPGGPVDPGRAALFPMARRLPWVLGASAPERGDPASRIEAV